MPEKSPVILRITPGSKAYNFFRTTTCIYGILSPLENFDLLDSEINSKIFDHLEYLFLKSEEISDSRISITEKHLPLLLSFIDEIVEALKSSKAEELKVFISNHISRCLQNWNEEYLQDAQSVLESYKKKFIARKQFQQLIQKIEESHHNKDVQV